MKIMPTDDYEAPIEEFPGHLGHEMDQMLFFDWLSPKDKALWTEYIDLLVDEAGLPRRTAGIERWKIAFDWAGSRRMDIRRVRLDAALSGSLAGGEPRMGLARSPS